MHTGSTALRRTLFLILLLSAFAFAMIGCKTTSSSGGSTGPKTSQAHPIDQEIAAERGRLSAFESMLNASKLRLVRAQAMMMGKRVGAPEPAFDPQTGTAIEPVQPDNAHDIVLEETENVSQYENFIENSRQRIQQLEAQKGALAKAPPKPTVVRADDDPAMSNGGGGCFTPDTLVLLDSGTFKRIADLNVGEHVQSYDESTGEVVAKEVTKLYEADQDHYFLINGKLKVTATHPFYTAEREWKTVSALQVGDRIASHGTPLEIVSIERVAVDHHVYNFRVEDSHNYFVSPDGQDLYLVHNCK